MHKAERRHHANEINYTQKSSSAFVRSFFAHHKIWSIKHFSCFVSTNCERHNCKSRFLCIFDAKRGWEQSAKHKFCIAHETK